MLLEKTHRMHRSRPFDLETMETLPWPPPLPPYMLCMHSTSEALRLSVLVFSRVV